MRLQDILFCQGFGTRYDCAQIVLSGGVTISGEVHDDPLEDVCVEGLEFSCYGKLWPYREKAVIALNKPAGYECSMKPSAHPSVMTLLPGQLRKRNVQPVGRLDVDTTGLLIMTDDGPLQHRLIHPKRHVSKIYEVTCRYPVTKEMQDKLLNGVVLDDDPKPVAAKDVELIDEKHIRMTLVQGKYHQVKRMIAACSNRCDALHRSGFGAFRLPEDLKLGEWIWITREDII